jgi:hypothetical protein
MVLAQDTPSFSDKFLTRVAEAYKRSAKQFGGSLDSMWEGFAKRKIDVHNALISGDLKDIRGLLQTPAANYLFYGFDILYPERIKKCLGQTATERAGSERSLAADIVRLAEGVGTRRIRDPKKPTEYSPLAEVDLDGLIAEVGDFLGIDIKFPAPFASEYGLETNFGVASYRSVNAFYQAYLVKQFVPSFGNKVCEIGGGSGRTAYFSKMLGIENYTIVDVPLTNVAQAIFLGASLGEDCVRLAGEKDNGQPITIISPGDMTDYGGIVLDVDSMPEMSLPHIREYVDNIRSSASVFLSINHEAHEARIGEMASPDAILYRRGMYSMRPGYLEELFIYRWPATQK